MVRMGHVGQGGSDLLVPGQSPESSPALLELTTEKIAKLVADFADSTPARA